MGIVRVQTSKSTSGSANPLTTTAISTTAGNMLVVLARNANGTGNITSISNTGGDTWVNVVDDESHDPHMWLYYANNINGNASDQISITWASGVSAPWIFVIELSGVATSSPVDISGSNPGSAATDCVSTAFSTAAAGEYIVMGCSQGAFSVFSAGTDFTLIDGHIGQTGFDYGGAEQYIPGGTLSSYTAHITSDTSAQYTTVWAAFKAAAAATGGGPIVRGGSLTHSALIRGGRLAA